MGRGSEAMTQALTARDEALAEARREGEMLYPWATGKLTVKLADALMEVARLRDLLTRDGICPECGCSEECRCDESEEKEEDNLSDDRTCPDCNGSGEGPADGTRCRRCRGTGEVASEADQAAYEASRDDYWDSKLDDLRCG